MKNTNAPATNTLDAHIKRYSSARADLLIMTALTVVNIVLLFTGSETIMLFSAIIPYTAVASAYIYNGSYIFGFGIAILLIGLYFLCWFMSKKNYQWLIVATILFALDTLYMIPFYDFSTDLASSVIDIAIHALVLYYLIAGIITGKKLKSLKEENSLGEGIGNDVAFNETQSEEADFDNDTENSIYKRRADTDIKFRVLAEGTHNGHSIIYRRVKRNNELVIDDYVYDEIEMLIETPHVLSAKIDGDLIQAGLRNPSNSFISVNGKEIVKKIRIM